MNVVSEFLVMAVTLLDIKCRMLLPKEVNEDGEEEDPRAELVQQLLEYKMYKYMSYELKDKMTATGNVYCRSMVLPDEIKQYRPPVDHEELLGDITLQKLHRIFQDIMKRQVDRTDPIRSQYGNIVRDEVDVDRKTIFIEEYIKVKKNFSFRDLLEKQGSKLEVVVTFLVILELMKTGKVTIVQEDLFDDIYITSNEVLVEG
jgi:segregation and condensation protein A